MRRIAILALMLFSAVACGRSGEDTAVADTEASLQQIAGDWQIASLSGREVDGGITLSLRSNSTFSGEAPCNRYSGDYNVSGKVGFSVGPIRATRRACPDLPTESEYFAVLEGVTEYRLSLNGSDLRLLNKSGKAVLVFVPAG